MIGDIDKKKFKKEQYFRFCFYLDHYTAMATTISILISRMLNTLLVHKLLIILREGAGGGGMWRNISIYKLYVYVWTQGAWYLSHFGLKMGIKLEWLLREKEIGH